jgi:hypothetical protein
MHIQPTTARIPHLHGLPSLALPGPPWPSLALPHALTQRHVIPFTRRIEKRTLGRNADTTRVSSACSRRRRGNSPLLWTHLGQLAGGRCRATVTADLAIPASALRYAHFQPHLRLLQPQGLLSRWPSMTSTRARIKIAPMISSTWSSAHTVRVGLFTRREARRGEHVAAGIVPTATPTAPPPRSGRFALRPPLPSPMTGRRQSLAPGCHSPPSSVS